MALNVRETLFAAEYIASRGNAFRAAVQAGYSEKTAAHATEWVVLNPKKPERYKPELADHINGLLERLHSEKTADAQEVMEYLTAVLRGESRSAVLCLCGDGRQQVVEKPPEEKERLRAAELLGKVLGLTVSRLELSAEDMDLQIAVDYGDGAKPEISGGENR